MTANEFNKLLEARLCRIRELLSTKAGEYASDDRLHNFKHNLLSDHARTLTENPAEVCWGYMRKHLQSIYDMAHGLKPVTKELIDEKITDALNYLILLEAIFTERISNDVMKRFLECSVDEPHVGSD